MYQASGSLFSLAIVCIWYNVMTFQQDLWCWQTMFIEPIVARPHSTSLWFNPYPFTSNGIQCITFVFITNFKFFKFSIECFFRNVLQWFTCVFVEIHFSHLGNFGKKILYLRRSLYFGYFIDFLTVKIFVKNVFQDIKFNHALANNKSIKIYVSHLIKK